MSWQSNWQGGSRGTFQRSRKTSEEGEEGEESEHRAEDGEMEEEGEIAPSGPVRNPHSSHLECNGPQFRVGARGPNNPRFAGTAGGARERLRSRHSFSGMASPRMPPNGAGFQGGNINGPPFQREMLQPPASNPFRQDSYRDTQGNRDLMEPAQQVQSRPEGAREYRDFSAGLPTPNGSRNEPGPHFGTRDFRNEPPPPKRDFDGPPRPPRDFRGDLPGPREFRGGLDTGRNFRNDRDYRDRSEIPPNRDFRAGNQPPNRDMFGRDRVGSASMHREGSKGSLFVPSVQREASFRERDTHFRDGAHRDGMFHEGPKREQTFRESAPRMDPPHRDGFTAREHSAKHAAFTSRGPPNRDAGHMSFNRDANRAPAFDDGRDESTAIPRGSNGQMMQTGSLSSQPSPYSPSLQKTTIPQGIQSHKLRPTDPRRRASTANSASPFVTKSKIMDATSDPRHANGQLPVGVGPSTFNSVPPASHPPRRMSSYSSLADNSIPAAAHVKSGDLSGIHGAHSRQSVAMRSPVPARRLLSDSLGRSESGGYVSNGLAMQHQRERGDRGRNQVGGPPASPGRGKMQQNTSSPSRPPVAPILGPSSTTHDPRSRVPANGNDDVAPTRDSNMTTTTHTRIGATASRERDWKDRPIGNHLEASAPRTSPTTQKNIRSVSSDGTSSNPPKFGVSKQAGKSKPIPTVEAAGKSKPEQTVSLHANVLGDASVVKRAKAVVKLLCEIMPNQKSFDGDGTVLPSKQEIMTAVAEIERKIKESQKDSVKWTSDKKFAKELEKNEREDEVARLAALETRRKEELVRAAEEEKHEYKARRAAGFEKMIGDRQSQFMESRNQVEKELDLGVLQRQGEMANHLKDAMESDIVKAALIFDKNISYAKGGLEETVNTEAKIESRIATLETEYETLPLQKSVASEQKLSIAEPMSNTLNQIQSITAQNRKNAKEARVFSFSLVADDADVDTEVEKKLQSSVDPKYNKTNGEWSVLANKVSSLNEALFDDPSGVPYYEQCRKQHSGASLTVKEYIQNKQTRLLEHWCELAEEYEVRKRLFEKQQKKLAKKGQQRNSVCVGGRSSILGDKKTKENTGLVRGVNVLESTGRTSNNPYRRARRGNEVRSEYEQEQIIAEIAAKEAMEKRITHGGCRVPRQICRLEREITASYIETFTAQKIDDPVAQEDKSSRSNIWTDMEKCIFLDRFLQFPKDFRRIATFLRNKTTKDCVAFYYDSKQAVPYKGALKEHVMRRKRKGDYQVWDSSIQAAISVGAFVAAGSSEEAPVAISLPASDCTFATRMLHPLKVQVLESMGVEKTLDGLEAEFLQMEDQKPKSRKRNRDPLFSLGKEHTKFLRVASQESMAASQMRGAIIGEENIDSVDRHRGDEIESTSSRQGRKAPQKWTNAEKNIFVATLEEHGRDWGRLADAVGTKSISQIKNFYYDYKKQSGKHRVVDKKSSKQIQFKSQKEGISEDGSQQDKHHEDHDQTTIRDVSDPTRMVPEEKSTQGAAARREVEETSDFRGGSSNSFRHLEQSEHPGEHGNAELIKHLLTHQLQQQQQLEHQQLQRNQQPQSALQQLLSQHHQRDHHPALGQLTLEDAHRLLQHQSHSHQQHLLSHLVPWLSASQLLHSQSRIQQAQAAAALQQQDTSQLSSVSDIADVANLQRLLQMQQVNQNPFGIGQPNHTQLHSLLLSNATLSSPAASTLPTSNQAMNQSASLLSQLEKLSAQGLSTADQSENVAAFAGAQRLLGFGNSVQGTAAANGSIASGSIPGGLGLSLAASTASMEPRGMSEALNLLARTMPMPETNTIASYNGIPDRHDGGKDHYTPN